MLGHDFSLRFQPVTLVYLFFDKPSVMPYHWIYFGDGDGFEHVAQHEGEAFRWRCALGAAEFHAGLRPGGGGD